MKNKKGCPEKHTRYQPSDAEWRCPKCGATPEFAKPFSIFAYVIWDGCDKLHDQDEVACERCGYAASGKAFAARCRKARMVPCPTCKGCGLVKGDAKPKPKPKPKPARKRAS